MKPQTQLVVRYPAIWALTIALASFSLTFSASAACVSPPPGLVSWWSGNDTANDLVGTNHGIFLSPGYGVGEVSQAFSFDGSGNNVRVPASVSLDVGAGNGLTIEAWVNPADLSSRPIVEWALNGDYGVHLWANALNPGFIYASLFGTDGQPHVIESATSVLTTNVFQHVGLTYDKASGIARLFLNGAIIRELAVGTFTPRTSSDLYVGYRPAGSPYGPIPFVGKIDEVSIYNRALSTNEVQAIYSAGGEGKCAPVPPPSCSPIPSGLVGWWRGETNALDQAGTNNGTLAGNVNYGAGRVGQGFTFDGSGDGVSVGNPAELQLQTFTIEAWIKRANVSIVSLDPYNSGILFSHGGGGYGFALWTDGRLFLTKNGESAVFSTITVTDTNLHHVAVTKIGGTVAFYVDGVAEVVTAYDPGFVFGGSAAIGARGGDFAASFFGAIDELSIYNRSLAAGEIQAIYGAGENGKCLSGVTAPLITSHPASQTVTTGGTVTFNVTALGTAPLSYQWMLNSTNIPSATADSLVLTNVQLANAGLYSVIVSNLAGTATSSNATLTVNILGACVAPPAGLVSWWRGEANVADQMGTNSGTLIGNTTYGSGRVGQGFVFDGSGDGVSVGNAPGLQLQNFTIEAWIKRASSSIVSHDPYHSGILFSYGGGGYGFALYDDGRLFLTMNEVSAVFSTLTITDTNLHHVAVTKIAGTVVFYLDGIGKPATAYDPGFVFNGPAAIGARGGDMVASFLGSIDEISVYNRQLSSGEIQAIYTAGSSGKCLTGSLPLITSQPASQTVTIGETATFNVTAIGTAPLSYQWQLNSTNIVGAIADSLVLTNAQLANAGLYSVIVSNLAGTTTSSNATLTVNALVGCVNPPAGLVGWWRGENNALDQLGANNGTLIGDTTYAVGRVSQGFVFDGSHDGVSVGNPTELQLQTFTIEAWIKRSDASRGSQDPQNSGLFFCYAWGGYAFALHDNGKLFLSKVG